jgi:hypothetical protein
MDFTEIILLWLTLSAFQQIKGHGVAESPSGATIHLVNANDADDVKEDGVWTRLDSVQVNHLEVFHVIKSKNFP